MRIRVPIAMRIAGIFSVITVLLFLAVSILLALQLGTNLRNDFKEEYRRIGEARAGQISELVDKISWTLHATAQSPDLTLADHARVEAAVLKLNNSVPEGIAGLFYAYPDGSFFTSQGARGDISDRKYYAEIVKEGKSQAISEAVVSKSLGIPMIIFAQALKSDSGELRGLLAFQIPLETISTLVAKVNISKNGISWISDSTGKVIAHQDKSYLMKTTTDTVTGASAEAEKPKSAAASSEAQGTQVTAAASAMATPPSVGASPVSSSVSGSSTWLTSTGSEMTSYSFNIEKTPGWILTVSVPSSEIDGPIFAILRSLAIILVIALIVTVVISLLVGRSVVRPIHSVGSVFGTLAAGEADLTMAVHAKSDDELGDLIRDFNTFVAKLRVIILELKETQAGLDRIGLELGASAGVGESSATELTESVKRVENLIRKQSGNVESSSAAIEQITQNISSLDQKISSQSASVSQASASIEQMIGNIGSVTGSVQKIAERFGELESAAGNGRELQSLAAVRITEISERSTALLEANEVITKIASATNLLAMNAAIEAAHAGEAGKGFSVVADEIRKLAETSAEQSQTIGKDLMAVQGAIAQIVETSQNSEAAFSQVSGRISELTNLVREVNAAMIEQKQGSAEVLQALQTLEKVTVELSERSTQVSSGNHTILTDVTALRDAAAEISEGMGKMSANAVAVSENAQRISTSSDMTRASIDRMEANIGRFTV